MSNSSTFLRSQLLVDSVVQTELFRRILIYAATAMVYFLTIVVIEETVLHQDRSFGAVLKGTLDQSIFWLPGLLVLVPLMLYDLLKVTHRFTGPMYSLRREMKRLVDGKSKRSIHFRSDDYWNDMASTFNLLREELIELRESKDKPANIDDAKE